MAIQPSEKAENKICIDGGKNRRRFNDFVSMRNSSRLFFYAFSFGFYDPSVYMDRMWVPAIKFMMKRQIDNKNHLNDFRNDTNFKSSNLGDR